MDERSNGQDEQDRPTGNPSPAGRVDRDPDEGPAVDGGSGLDSDAAASSEQVGGGD